MAAQSENLLIKLRDAVWHPTPASMRLLALLGVITNAGIIVSGGVVRLTASGLGCPTWPKCTGDSLVPTSTPHHSPVNMAIEFGNRTLTFLVLAVAVAVFVAAYRLRSRRPALLPLAALQPLGVVSQAGLGGITVLTGLHPATVAAHYMLSAALVLAAVALHTRAGEGDETPRPLVRPGLRRLAFTLGVVVVALLAAGTIVTGSGPHAGDDEAPRFGFEIEQVARAHGALAWATVALTIALMIGLRRAAAPGAIQRRAAVLFAVELAQGVIGYVQYLMGVPAVLVGLHMLGSALMWIATLQVIFALRDRGPRADRPAGDAGGRRVRDTGPPEPPDPGVADRSGTTVPA
ncbi:COX15/CtaA family protein [Actinomadura alba]|uniref:COX15/CtaA family protein n=1 Tax=Actinomadura alba TaxID=406431 RepID=UPI0028ACF3A2|nr:COX15/CtaA family protein [Actinomadura alba]